MVDIPTHVLIATAFAGLYAFDCVTLIGGEYILVKCGSEGRVFGVVSPGRVTILCGKIVYFLPPFHPWTPLRRVKINRTEVGAESQSSAGTPMVIASFFLFVVHAAALFLITALGSDTAVLLTSLAALYVSTAIFSVAASKKVNSVKISHAILVVICPPNALNLIRRSELDRRATNPISAFSGALSATERTRVANDLAPFFMAFPSVDYGALREAIGIHEELQP